MFKLRQNNSLLTRSQLTDAGVQSREIINWIDEGKLERLQRGVYRVANCLPMEHESLLEVSLRIPKAVVCLVSALEFHQLTTAVANEVQIALPQGWRTPKLDYPPLQVVHFSKHLYKLGIETHEVEKHEIKVYSPEKTLVDIFYYRNKVGKDIILESLKNYLENTSRDIPKLVDMARARRVEKSMQPYLESLV